MTKLSRRGGGLGQSVTLAINTKAKAIAARGEKVVRFGVGEPDFDTPLHIKEAARRALDTRGVAAYTPVAGTADLREAVARSYRDTGMATEAADVIVSCGAKHSLFNALAVLVDDDDEVLIPIPYWVSYPAMVEAQGGRCVYLDTLEDGCILTPEKLEAAITPRTRVLLFNSPGNPSGVTHSKEQMAALGPVLERHPQITVVSDEIYQHLVYQEAEFHPFVSACPALEPRTLTVRGVSKSFAMTGWRIGYATGPKDVVAAMIRYQSHSTSNPSAIAQVAAQAALTGPMEPVEKMKGSFFQRRNRMLARLEEIGGAQTPHPDGAFYCFPEVAAWLGERTGKTPLDFAAGLLEKERVAIVPGEAFGAPTHVRFSYACSEEDIDEGMTRLARYVRG